MIVRCVEHMDKFSATEYIFWLEVDNIPREFIDRAKEIDKEDYEESCFGICVICTEAGWAVCEDEPGCQLFYIDNDGNKHWMPYELSTEEEHDAIEYCINNIMEE